MSTHRSRSTGSRNSSNGRRGVKKSDSSALRKHVLQKNHKERISRSHLEMIKRTTNTVARGRSMSPAGQMAVFQLDGPQRIRVKKTVAIEENKLMLHTTIYIYSNSMDQKQYERAMDSQVSVATGRSYREDQATPMETISQTVYYGRKMIRLVRDVVLKKECLSGCWETADVRGVRDGWQTMINGSQAEFSGLKTTSMSRNSEMGYVNTTGIVFLFDQTSQPSTTELKLCPSEYKYREEMPNLEDCIRIGEKVKTHGSTLEFIQEVHLLPLLRQLNHGGYVEEIREYLFNPMEQKVKFLDRTATTSFDDSIYMPDFSNAWSTPNSTVYDTPQETMRTPFDTPMETVFGTPLMTRNEEISPLMGADRSKVYITPLSDPSAVHPIAIPGPQTHRPVPRLILDPIPATSPTMTTAISPGKKRISQEISLDDKNPRMTMKVSRKDGSRVTHKHAMTMAVDIGGEACEFTGNISYEGPAGMEFTPKRVVVDGKLLWQQSNDWNPTSITNSQINMTLDSTLQSHK